MMAAGLMMLFLCAGFTGNAVLLDRLHRKDKASR